MTKTWLMSAQFTNVKADFTPFFVKLTSTNNDFDVIYSTIASLPTTSNSNLIYINIYIYKYLDGRKQFINLILCGYFGEETRGESDLSRFEM